MAAQLTSYESLFSQYRKSLQEFGASSDDFRLLDIVPPDGVLNVQPGSLYVLDSSFNPPTIAHTQMVTTAIKAANANGSPPSRVLLLLAIQNADKLPKPALFEHRLAMMRLAAEDIQQSLSQEATRDEGGNIWVTKHPYFMDKAVAITGDGSVYPKEIEQVHLTGYDTLVRIFEPKYYADGNLGVLDPFFSLHRLRVTLRTGADWGDRSEQMSFLADLARGDMEKLGARRGWASRIEFVESNAIDRAPMSSTAARNAAKDDFNLLFKLVTPRVYEYIRNQQLYVNNE
ncbi:cytidylyltransferase family protein [Microsporum canis CBS 113480]|uniref:Cytidylyltransferase family protein n=1 Tax=Arthroderma otae (strain ATCC MYA-4605 / CBS 113480) TaxID=554155 RepID=C5FEZ5_ARTOC|nr:cytidylyltransferase family protein [Microsporum canis CBS 113480]EEQ28289.1 cytidylyltransferase family protein [Microsporum canis CBS 113480]